MATKKRKTDPVWLMVHFEKDDVFNATTARLVVKLKKRVHPAKFAPIADRIEDALRMTASRHSTIEHERGARSWTVVGATKGDAGRIAAALDMLPGVDDVEWTEPEESDPITVVLQSELKRERQLLATTKAAVEDSRRALTKALQGVEDCTAKIRLLEEAIAERS